MILIPNDCDILGEGKDDQECNCNQDNLFKIAESLFLARDLPKLGKFVGEIIDNCLQKPITQRKKRSGAKSEWNIFVSKKLVGCGKEGAKSCSDTMIEAGKEWQEQKKQKGE